MKIYARAIAAVIVVVSFQVRADDIDSASCGAMTIADQCRISWKFSRRANSHYVVQQFDPLKAEWRTLAELPTSTLAEGGHEQPVEAGNLYRVLTCDDSKLTTNCSGSTMVWAPFVQPQDQVQLIPSRVPMTGSEDRFGEPIYGLISKKDSWLTQVNAYNVIMMANAIAFADISDLPNMTPVKDIRTDSPDDPIEQVQFNVYWFYSAAQGEPIDQPPLEPFIRPPHEHPERHPQ